MPVRHDARWQSPVIDSRKSIAPARRRHGARRVANPRARAPSHPPRGDFESHRKSVARTLDGRMPARIAGGPSCFIQAAKGALRSPRLKHVPPDRSIRHPDLPCLSCSYFSYPPDSIERRARPPDRSSRPAVHAKSLTSFRAAGVRLFPAFRKQPATHRTAPGIELIVRINWTISSRSMPFTQTHLVTSRIIFISKNFANDDDFITLVPFIHL